MKWETVKETLQPKNAVHSPFFDIVLFTTLLYVKYLFFFKATSIENELFFTRNGKLFTIISLILIGCLFYFVSSQKRKWSLFMIGVFLSILMFIDTLYFRHFRDYTSFSLIYQMNQVGDIKVTILQLLKLQDIFYFVDILMTLFVLIYFKKQIKSRRKKVSLTKVILFLTVWSMVLFFNLYGAIDYSGALKHRNTNSITSCQMGAINFHLLDTYDFLVSKLTTDTLSEKELEKIKESFTDEYTNPTSYWGMFKGKNVIMVQMESFSNYLINLKVEGKEVTPNLNQLIQKSYYANNFYAQIADGHTSDAEFIVLNSLFPLNKGSVSIMYGMNEYHSLPKLLSEEGYYTVSAHGFREEFWNRVNMHKSLGFKESYFADDYVMTKKTGLGISDKEFFVQSVEKLNSLPEPFFSFLITLQNHQPFEGRDESFYVGKLEGTKIGNYLQSSYEADKAIGILMKELETSGLLENTIVIFYGDHDSELPYEEMEKLFPNLDLIDIYKLKKVPFIVFSPEMELIQVDNQPLGQIDIMPSLLHLLGIKTKVNLMYGENIFAYKENKTVGTIKGWHIGNDYIFGNEYNDLNKANAFHLVTEEKLELTEEMIEADKKYKEQAKSSDRLIKANGLKELIKEQ